MKRIRMLLVSSILITLLIFPMSVSRAQGPEPRGIQADLGLAFTYQGFLSAGGEPITDACDFEFGLWDDPITGTQAAGPLERPGISVEQGRFTVQLDFGEVFDGTAFWLEIAVKCGGEADYTTLVPRQELTASPYALHSQEVPWTGISDMPAGFADDIDNDALVDLFCTNGEIAEWDGSAWVCADDDVDDADADPSNEIEMPTSCTNGEIAEWDGSAWVCADDDVDDADADPANEIEMPTSCANGEIAEWDGSAWVCATDDDTPYSAGFGLILSNTVFAADPTELQVRVGDACGAGYAIRQINENGTVVCQFIDSTTYSAGTGLVLSGTVFIITTTYRLPQLCSGGEIAEWDGSVWVCATDDVDDADADPTNELNLSFSLDGNTLVITDAGGGLLVDLTPLIDDADPDPTNELNTAVALNGTDLEVTDAGGTFTVDLSGLIDDADADPTNELNLSFSLDGNTLVITDAGGGLLVDLTPLIDDADADPTNELNLSFSLNGTTLVITDAGGVLTANLSVLDTLANLSCANGEIAKWNGSAWACADDDDTSYSAGTGLSLIGTQFSLAVAYRLPQACANGEIAEWNGTAWVCADDDDTTYSAGDGLDLVGTIFGVDVTDILGVGLSESGNNIDIATSYRLPQGCPVGRIAEWSGGAWVCAIDENTTDHGALSGLGDDDHPQYFYLSQNETVNGRPAFNGGTSGSTAPFGVDSNYVVANLNADLLDGRTSGNANGNIPINNGALNTNLNADMLDGLHESSFFRLSQNETVTGRPAFNGGTSGSTAPFSVDSTFRVTSLNADLLDGYHASAFALDPHNHWGESWSGGGAGLSLSGGTVGLYGSGSAYGIRGVSAATAVYGDGGTYGVYADGTTAVRGAGSSTGVYGSATTYGLYGSATSTAVRADGGSMGVNADGSSYGVYASSSSTGVYGSGAYGVYGSGTSTAVRADGGTYGLHADGTTYGVYGSSGSTAVRGSGGTYGVYGSGTYGVYGSSGSTAVRGSGGTYGVYGSGTYGVHGNGSSYGVRGVSNATAIYADGGAYGVYATGPTGTGVRGAGSNYGLYGTAGNTGVYGSANTYGVYAIATTYGVYATSAFYGVFGTASSTTGFGGYFRNTSSGVALRAMSSGVSTDPIIEAWNPGDREFYVDSLGDVYADGTFNSPAADFAEMLPAQDGLEPGDVLVIGEDGLLAQSSKPYQSSAVGVYSTQPAFLAGSGEDIDMTGQVPLAVVGIVPVKVSAENGPILPGDLLTTSSTPGHAMKASPITVGEVTLYSSGVIIGKAMEGLQEGTGVILMLVVLQ